jgi:glycosyltransferase involved in cell wall biosynthesis
MVSIHFTRWVTQLKDSGHDIYWFDPLDGSYDNESLNWIYYCKQWRLKWDFPGRYVIKNKIPWIYKIIKRFNERPVADGFETFLKEVQPDIVHSFVMYMSCAPILEVMKKHRHIKWIYSAWGNDLYFYHNNTARLREIKACLPHINYMFADCKRDINIAKKYGFKGESLGAFPGGGGYNLNELTKLRMPFKARNTLLVKGYEHHFGRCNVVLEALLILKELLSQYQILVYGDNEIVQKFVNENDLDSWSNFRLLGKISQEELFKLKGEALIYIGNSISDGMPNTLLEAIIMGAFPIQSNPGGATEEIIEHSKNGLLIQNPVDSKHIKEMLEYALSNSAILEEAFVYNLDLSKSLDFETIKSKVLKAYNSILLK